MPVGALTTTVTGSGWIHLDGLGSRTNPGDGLRITTDHGFMTTTDGDGALDLDANIGHLQS